MSDDFLPALGPRDPESHKGDYGRVLIVAGSRGMIGAACLAAGAALRSGAGIVTLATPASQQPIAAGKLTSAMTLALPETAQGSLAADAAGEILSVAADFQVVALGPGLSLAPETVACVRHVVRALDRPLVLDADGLNALAGHGALLAERDEPTVLTPHPGEYRRLDPDAPRRGESGFADRVVRFAALHRAVVAVKGHRTIVSDGRDLYTNRTGNPGMATGGSGDVLTGIVGGFLAGGLEPMVATCLAVHLHGAAGDRAALRLGQISMTAEDLLDELPGAILDHQGRRAVR